MPKKWCIILLYSISGLLSAQNINTDSLLSVIKNPANDSAKTTALIELAKSILKANPDSARAYANQAYKIAVKKKWEVLQASSLRTIGVSYAYQGEYQHSLTTSLKAWERIQTKEDSRLKGVIAHNIGTIYIELGNYPKGIEFCKKFIAITNNINDKKLLPGSYLALGNAYSDMKNDETALKYYSQALIYAKEVDEKQSEAIAYNNMGNIYSRQNQLRQAEEYFKQALSLKYEIGDTLSAASSLINLGRLYAQMAESGQHADTVSSPELYAIAFDHIEKVISILQRFDNKLYMSTALCTRGNWKIKTGKIQEGIKDCKRALVLADSINVLSIKKDVCECLTQGFKKIGDYANAIKYYEIYVEIKDSLFSKKNIDELNRLQFEKKQAIKQVEFENEQALKNKEIEKQRHKVKVLIAGVILLLLLSSLFYYQKIQTIRSNRELVKRNLELMHSDAGFPAFSKIKDAQQAGTKKAMADEQIQALVSRIEQVMQEEKPYLNTDLTLASLAKQLNSNTSYVSKAINDAYSSNFSSYINEYRVKEARKMLADPAFNHFSIEGIAKQVGFNSIPPFNAAFKKLTGLTPSFFKSYAQKQV